MTKNRILLGLAAFSMGLVAAATLTTASDAQAFWSRQDSSACTTQSASNYASGANTSAANSIIVNCPMVDTSDMPKESLAWVTLFVDAYAAGLVSRCAHFYNANSWSCGSTQGYSGSGIQSVAVPAYAGWSSHFGFVQVVLPPSNPDSILKGISSSS